MTTHFGETRTVEPFIIEVLKNTGWSYIPSDNLNRDITHVMVEDMVKQTLMELNPEIKKVPDRADEVIYRLRAILLSANSDGLVKTNEEFAEWLKGEKTMPFGENNEHIPVKLIDFEKIERNKFIVTNQYIFKSTQEKIPDIVLLVNGIPLVIGEIKTAFRPAISWVDGAVDIVDDYQRTIPSLFVPNVLCFATEGKEYMYGTVGCPVDKWSPWRCSDEETLVSTLNDINAPITKMLNPATLLDILQYFTLFATDNKNRKIKILCRAQQYYAANKIVERVKNGRPKKGLIWHFQGSGKSLLMVFAAQKLRMEPLLKNPTVIVVVDRVDLDSQITATFKATDIPNTVPADSKEELEKLLLAGTRKIIITMVHKFGDIDRTIDTRDNIIMLVDEAHRTQEGGLGIRMRNALPNAFLFGLTGTPINSRDRNTFIAFGAEEDEGGYLSKYSLEESIRDKATLKLHFEPKLVEMHVDKEAIDEAFANMTDSLDEENMEELSKRAGKMSTYIRLPERIGAICEDIAKHYTENVEPNGFKAMIVCFDRACCAEYKKALDTILPPEISDVVMTTRKGDPDEWKKWDRKKEDEDKLLDRFRDPDDPLKIIIVTSKLLTGFDAPILQTMYLDKPMKGHTLLQAICRINRPYPMKQFGLIVDYIGVFDEVAKALDFDDKSIEKVATIINELIDELPDALEKCLSYFEGVDRTLTGFEALIAAQECLPNNEVRDAFAKDYNYLAGIWEAISPNHILNDYKNDYKWLSQIYESIQPSGGTGRLIWHTLGAKTIQIVNENVHIEAIRDDLETLILDEEVIKDLIENPDERKTKEIEIKICQRLRKHKNNPRFKKLGERLEELKQKYEDGFINSLEYLKQLLQIARETIEAERTVEPEDNRKKAKAALTELFQETKTDKTPAMIEQIVNDIDSLVNVVRFDGWQWTNQGEREVKQALRKALLKYQLHKDNELFDKAYNYIREYY